MKVYLENGYGGMKASLSIYPQKLQHFSITDNPIPEVVREPLETHILRIIGEENQIIDFKGSLSELQELVKLMSDVMEIVKE